MVSRASLANSWGQALNYALVRDNDIPVQRGIKAIGSPRLITFVLRLSRPGDLSKALKLEEEMALRMGADSCRISRYFGEVVVEVPLPRSLWNILDAATLTLGEGLWLSLGKTSRMSPVRCKLDTPNIAPVLVAGRTGSGKTEALRLMVWQLAKQNTSEDLGLILFDPKKSKFGVFSRLPHLLMPILFTPRQAFNALRWLMVELDMRLQSGETCPAIVFVVDELIEMLRVDERAAGGALGRLAQLGRDRGIHLILATQRPDRRYMDRLAAANLGLRLVGRVADTTEARVACGLGGSGAHKLCDSGDFLGVVAGTIQRLAIALVSDKDLESLPAMESPPVMPKVRDINLGALVDGEKREGGEVFSYVEYATALTGWGIGRLKQALRIGQPRATRLRQSWATPVLGELSKLGFEVKHVEET